MPAFAVSTDRMVRFLARRPVVFDDPLANRQSDSGSCFPGAEEGFEDAIDDLGVDPWSSITNQNRDLTETFEARFPKCLHGFA